MSSHVVLEFIENFGNQDAAQMFVDLNKSKRMSSSELAYLDGRDPVVNIIKDTLSTTDWARERTDTIRSNPASNSSDILTIHNLKTIVKALEVGVKQPFPEARRLYMETPDGKEESIEKLKNFLLWLPTARMEYQNLIDHPETNVPDERTRHYAYKSGRKVAFVGQRLYLGLTSIAGAENAGRAFGPEGSLGSGPVVSGPRGEGHLLRSAGITAGPAVPGRRRRDTDLHRDRSGIVEPPVLHRLGEL